MTLRPITVGEQTKLDDEEQWSELFLTVVEAETVATGEVLAAPGSTDQVGVVQVTNFVLVPGMNPLGLAERDYLIYVGDNPGTYNDGFARLRNYAGDAAASIDVGEVSEIKWEAGQHLTIVNEVPLAPQHMRVDDAGVNYMDFDILYSDQHVNFEPTPILGPYVTPVWLEGASVTVPFDAAASWVLNDTAITYQWYFFGASSSTGDTTATPTATYDTPGKHMVFCDVTANGKVYRGIRVVRVHQESVDEPYRNFDMEECIGDYESGYWTARITLYDVVDGYSIRERAPVAIWARDYYGGLEGSLSPVSDREHILMVGWIGNETINWDAEVGSVTFELQGPNYWLNQMRGFPSGYEDTGGGLPGDWIDVQNLTPKKAYSLFLHERTTATRMTDVHIADNDVLIRQFDAQPGTLYSQLVSEADAISKAKPVANHLGAIYVDTVGQLVPSPDRTGWPIIATITETDATRPTLVERRTVALTGHVDLSGVAYDGTVDGSEPLFSLAPGHVPGWVGPQQELPDRLALVDQAHANSLAGLFLGWGRIRYPTVPVVFVSNNRFFDIAPVSITKLDIDATDTTRGIDIEIDMLTKAVSYVYNAGTGFLQTEVTYEELNYGDLSEASIIGDAPLDPPPPPPRPTPPPFKPIPVPIPIEPPVPDPFSFDSYVATEVGGVYYTTDSLAPEMTQPSWHAVNSGIVSLSVNQIYTDPYYPRELQYLRSGSNIQRRVNEGSWVTVLDAVTAQALYFAETGLDTAMTGYFLDTNWGDPGQVNTLWRNTNNGLIMIRSNDFGAAGSWYSQQILSSADGGGGNNLHIQGLNGAVSYGSSPQRFRITNDGGATWGPEVQHGWSGWSARCWAFYGQPYPISYTNNNCDTLAGALISFHWDYYNRLDNSCQLGFYLGRHSGERVTMSTAQSGLGYIANDLNVGTERRKIIQTTDAFASYDLTAPANNPNMDDDWESIWMPEYAYPLHLILGNHSPGTGLLERHTIAVYIYGDTVNDPGPVADVRGKAGPSPNTAPYTDSIPRTMGGMPQTGFASVPWDTF